MPSGLAMANTVNQDFKDNPGSLLRVQFVYFLAKCWNTRPLPETGYQSGDMVRCRVNSSSDTGRAVTLTKETFLTAKYRGNTAFLPWKTLTVWLH